MAANKPNFTPYRVKVTFEDGDELVLSSFHVARARQNSTSLPVDKMQLVCGQAYSVHVGLSTDMAPSTQLEFLREGHQPIKVTAQAPNQPLSLDYVRSFTVKREAAGVDKPLWYLVTYDSKGLCITNPRMCTAYLPREALDCPGIEAPKPFKRSFPANSNGEGNGGNNGSYGQGVGGNNGNCGQGVGGNNGGYGRGYGK